MKRQTSQGLQALLQVGLVLGLVLVLNGLARTTRPLSLLGQRIPLSKQWDLTQNKRFSLSDQTVKVVTSLKEPIKALAFVQKGPDEAKLKELLKRYEATSSSFSYSFEDLERAPLLAKKYNVKQPYTVVLESGSHTESITLPFGSDPSALESKLTSGLMRIQNPKTSVVYFTTGHGELVLDDLQAGMAELKTNLEGDNYKIKPLMLLEAKAVPDDASAVVVAGINRDLFPEEIKVLDGYLAKGGRVLWLATLAVGDKHVTLDKAQAFLAKWGVDLTNQLVVSMAMLGIQQPTRVLIPAGMHFDTSHPIAAGFKSSATFFPIAQAVNPGKVPAGGSVQKLVWTDDRTYTYKNALQAAQTVLQTQNPAAGFNPKEDKQGAATLAVVGTFPVKAPTETKTPEASPAPGASPSPAAAATSSPSPKAGASGSPSPESSASPKPEAATPSKPEAVTPSKPEAVKQEGRLVVIGNAELVTHNWISKGANGDLVMNAIGWLAERGDLIAVSRPSTLTKATALDEQQKSLLFRIGYLIPMLVFLAYFVVNGGRR